MLAKYYLSELGNPICASCAEESELESGVPLQERRNNTGDVLECICCREDIPFVGQTYTARHIPSAAEWERDLQK